MVAGQLLLGDPVTPQRPAVPAVAVLAFVTARRVAAPVIAHVVEKALIKTTKPGRDGTVRITFALPLDEPRGAVSVVGDFNDWNPFAHPLRKRANGTRSAAVTVPTGTTLRFRYLGEGGTWFNDDTAPAPDGQDASSIAV